MLLFGSPRFSCQVGLFLGKRSQRSIMITHMVGLGSYAMSFINCLLLVQCRMTMVNLHGVYKLRLSLLRVFNEIAGPPGCWLTHTSCCNGVCRGDVEEEFILVHQTSELSFLWFSLIKGMSIHLSSYAVNSCLLSVFFCQSLAYLKVAVNKVILFFFRQIFTNNEEEMDKWDKYWITNWPSSVYPSKLISKVGSPTRRSSITINTLHFP